MAAFRLVIIAETCPKFHRLGANHGVHARVVSWLTPENVDAEQGFLQLVGLTVQRFFYNVANEAAQPIGVDKAWAGQNFIECRSNGFYRDLARGRPGRVSVPLHPLCCPSHTSPTSTSV